LLPPPTAPLAELAMMVAPAWLYPTSPPRLLDPLPPLTDPLAELALMVP
jgi:hypothetical protein